jgi:hypothetical protein
MSGNQYRALTPDAVGQWGEDVFDAEFTSDEERVHLERGLLEIAPRPYRVTSDIYTVDGKPVDPGEVVELALPVDIETALVNGGHLERVRRDAHPTVELADEPDEDPAPAVPATKGRRKAAPAPAPHSDQE